MTESAAWPIMIEIDPAITDQVESHAYSNMQAEVGGMLVGRVEGGITTVVGAVPALSAAAEQVSLTFTHDVWNDILREVDARFPGQSIVGWYHTHPSFGLFLSEYDEFIQRNFFSSEGQVALVVDPIAGTRAWFALSHGALVKFGETSTRRGARGRSVVAQLDPIAGGVPTGRAIAFALLAAVVTGALVWGVGIVTRPPDTTAALQQRNAEFEVLLEQYQVLGAELAELDRMFSDPVLIYVVREGDSISSIAVDFYGLEEAAEFVRGVNGLSAEEEVEPGTLLRMLDVPGLIVERILRSEVDAPTWTPPEILPDRGSEEGDDQSSDPDPISTPTPSATESAES